MKAELSIDSSYIQAQKSSWLFCACFLLLEWYSIDFVILIIV